MTLTATPAPGSPAPFLTVAEVARLLGASYGCAYSLAISGQLGPATRIGRTFVYERAVAEPVIRDRRAELAVRQGRRLGATDVGA